MVDNVRAMSPDVASETHTNPLDLLLKWGALLVGATYALGYIAISNALLTVNLPLGSPRWNEPRHFVLGGVIIVDSLWPVVLLFLLTLVTEDLSPGAHEKRVARFWANHWLKVLIIAAAVAWYVSCFRTARGEGAPLFLALHFAADKVVAAALVSAVFVFQKELKRLNYIQKVGVIIGIIIILWSVAWQSGRILALHMSHASPEKQVHLMIAPDAIPGAERLGLTFPQRQKSDSAALSDTVWSVYSDEDYYSVLLRDGRIVQLRRDKVWGATH